jgi:N-acetylneuraminic acid mutarotase
VIYYIGGQELPEKRFNDIYTFNTETMEVAKVAPARGTPPRFARHSAVTIGNTIYLFGGFDGVSQHFHLAAYETDTNVWVVPEVVGSIPPSRTNHAAAAIGTKMYIFGGMYKDSTGTNDKLVFLNDMFVLDSSTKPLQWTRINQRGDIPAARCGHRLLALGSRLVLFGGGCGEQWDMKYSDVHIFNPSTNTWVRPKIHGQAPVCTFTVAFVLGVFLFVFGGQSLMDNNLTNDLYVLDTVSMEWEKLQAQNAYPSPRDMASGNVVDNHMHMFGGYCGSAIDNFYSLQMDPVLESSPRLKPTLPPHA